MLDAQKYSSVCRIIQEYCLIQWVQMLAVDCFFLLLILTETIATLLDDYLFLDVILPSIYETKQNLNTFSTVINFSSA